MAKEYRQSIADQIIILVMAFLIIAAFATQIFYYAIIPWIKNNLIDAIVVIVIMIVVFYLIYRGAKASIEYFGRGAGNWILEVIYAIKGTENPHRKREPEQKSNVYDANPQDVQDAIGVLVSMGWKRAEATQKVMRIVRKYPLSETDDVSKIVKKALNEGTG